MTEFGIAQGKRNAFANYVFDKKWEEFGNRAIHTISVDTKTCTIMILFCKNEGEVNGILATYDEFLLKTGVKESEFYSGSVV